MIASCSSTPACSAAKASLQAPGFRYISARHRDWLKFKKPGSAGDHSGAGRTGASNGYRSIGTELALGFDVTVLADFGDLVGRQDYC
jgi:hypothetical protein